MPEYTIIGATAGPGLGVLVNLARHGREVIGIGRSPTKIERISRFLKDAGYHSVRLQQQDLEVSDQFGDKLAGTRVLITATDASPLNALVRQMPGLERLVTIGSARTLSQFSGPETGKLKQLESDALNCGVPATVINPSLIYGATGYNNIERIVRILRFSPFIPLPAGGSSLIQPVHTDDVVKAILKCLILDRTIGKSLVVAGPHPVSYAEFVRQIGQRNGKRVKVVDLPMWMMKLGCCITSTLPWLPTIEISEIERMMEDKAFDITETVDLLGFKPVGFSEGLSLSTAFEESMMRFANLTVLPKGRHPT